jgi:hypothetical protein
MRNVLSFSVALFWALAGAASAASLDGLAVDVKNESEPVLCAEKDNVAVSFANKDVHAFRIEAAHPVYLSAGMRDNFEADWTACDMTADPSYAAPGQPRKVTLFEETNLWVVGYAFPAFWRPSTTTVRIGDRVEKGLHLLQVWVLRTDGAEEVLVLYPQDGYWRPRPMTPPNMRNTGYGSSFLVGPIDYEGRPHVKIKEVAFDPKSRTFTLDFEKGGKATLKMASVDTNRLALDVAFDKGVDSGPFAMPRIAVREKGAKGWREDNILKFDSAHATDVWMGRLSPSQHNTSAPDIVFNSFSDGPTPKRPKSEPPPTVEPTK